MNPAGSSGSIDFVICARFICAVCVSFSFFSFGSTDWTIFQHNSTYSFILIKFTLWCDACVCVDVTIDCAVKAYYVREFMLMSRTCCGLCERFPCENRERERGTKTKLRVSPIVGDFVLKWVKWMHRIGSDVGETVVATGSLMTAVRRICICLRPNNKIVWNNTLNTAI